MIYSELKTLVADYLHRADLTANIPGFISLAEAFLFRELSIRALEISVSGVATAGLIPLPTDCASVGRVTVSHSGAEAAIDYASNPRIDSAIGVPMTFTLSAGGLQLDSSAAGSAYTLFYTPLLSALSDANPSNWLLVNAPDLYLAASQLEGARYTQNAEQVAILVGALPVMLESVQRFTKRTGQPLRGGLQIKTRGAH